jgi:flavin-dependent dehydrogenase
LQRGGPGRTARTRLIDLLVVGGGPAGAAAAAAARAIGFDVELVTAVRHLHPGESLPPGTDAVLNQLFGAGALHWRRHRAAYGNRSAWGGAGLERSDFMLNPLGHGWHVDRRALDASLLHSLQAQGVRVHCATRAARSLWNEDRWEVKLDGTRPGLRARAIVDATGRAARVARSQGARRTRLDRLVAAYWLLANSEERGRDSATLVQAVPDGWWYTTPVPGQRRVVAFLTDADLLPPRAARTARDWHERLALAPHVANALARSGLSLNQAALITDASVAYLDQLTGPGWVAAGDAAVSFDPLSSQGILAALLMGRDAGQAVAAMLTNADPEPLLRYSSQYATLLESHMRMRGAYYALERRWPDAPFWTRRHSLTNVPALAPPPDDRS